MTDDTDGGAIPQILMIARTSEAHDLVMQCARGEIPFSGEKSLHAKFSERGWSRSNLYELVVNAKSLLSARKEQTDD